MAGRGGALKFIRGGLSSHLHFITMAASAMHVLELLRRAEAYPLSVKHVFEEFEGAGVHVGDLGNALRHLAWSLQRIWELRSAATDEVRQSILSDVQEVHRWIIQGVSMRRAEAAEARASFEKKVLELKNSGLCKEEIFGDSPLGDEMHVALEVVWVRKASVENWTAFELIARQYCASCGALCEAPGEPSYEAFVDIRYRWINH